MVRDLDDNFISQHDVKGTLNCAHADITNGLCTVLCVNVCVCVLNVY